MRTDDLIRGLAADPRTEASPGRAIGLLLPLGLLGAVVIFSLILHVRPDFAAALLDPRLMLKFAVTVSLAAASLLLLMRLARPGARAAPMALALFVPAGLLAIGIAATIGLRPSEDWLPGLIGHNARYCVVFVPLLGTPILAALLLAMRRGAPTRPGLAGAVAGLAAGGLGAAIYALHCPDDSPLFVMTWYSIGIAALTAVGTAIGRRLLAW